jgi:hypothetical protein
VKSVNLPIDLVVEIGLLRRGTSEGDVERMGRVGGTFEQFELADDWQILAEIPLLTFGSYFSAGAA